jgi:hypothetical protein
MPPDASTQALIWVFLVQNQGGLRSAMSALQISTHPESRVVHLMIKPMHAE